MPKTAGLMLYFRFLAPMMISLLAATPDPAQALPGDIYVSQCCSADAIGRVTPDGAVSVFATSGLSIPAGLAFDRVGNLFVANSGNNTVEEFTPGGIGTVFADTGLNRPSGLAFDAKGNLFVANWGNSTIEEFTPGGIATVFAGTGLNQPLGLTFDAKGNLFVVNAGDNTIEKFTSNGIGSTFGSLESLAPDFNFPSALVFDASGDLFVANWGGGIARFTPAGTQTLFAMTPVETEGLAFDGAGDLLVADGGGDVLSFAPNGDQQPTIATGLYVATGLAVEPAEMVMPEPAAALSIATAIAGLCLTMRQRKRC